MNDEYTASDRFAQRLANFVIRRRWLVIAAALLFAAAAGSGARFLEFSNNYRTFFSPENPYLVEFESFQETYTKNDNILFVVQSGDGAVFTPRMMDAVERLTAEAWKIPYTIRVDSITNFQHSVANGDELTVDDLIRDGLALSQEELSRRKAVALAEPLLSGNLISHDADTTGINVTLQYPEESLNEVPESAAYARGVAAEIQRKFGDVHIAISGVSMLNNAFGEAGTADAMTLVPLMYLVLVGVMIFALRSLSATFATVLVVGMSTVTSLGIAGYLGIKVDPISVTAPHHHPHAGHRRQHPHPDLHVWSDAGREEQTRSVKGEYSHQLPGRGRDQRDDGCRVSGAQRLGRASFLVSGQHDGYRDHGGICLFGDFPAGPGQPVARAGQGPGTAL